MNLFTLAAEDTFGKKTIFFQAQETQNQLFELLFQKPILDHVMSILVGGALGGGKTKALVGAIIGMALFYPGSRIYVCRKDFIDLRDTIYKDFCEICPPSLIAKPKGDLLDRVEAAHDILFTNKSLIMFRELKDLSGKFGLEVNMVAIEQVEEIEEKVYSAIYSRLRPWMKAPKNSPYVMVCAANPCNTWVKSTWIDEKKPYHWYLHFSPRKNTALLKERPNYIKDLETRFDASWVKKYIDGDWNAAVEGAIFPEFEKDIHVIEPFPIPAHWQKYLALDPHLAKPFWALYAAQAPGGATFFFHEVKGKEFQKSQEFLGDLKSFERGWAKPPVRIIDFSLAGVLHEKNDGKSLWDVIESENMIFENAIKNNKNKHLLDFKQELGKRPTYLYFFSSCKNLIYQLSNYQANDSDTPAKKQEDHLVDCALYIMNKKPWIEPGKIVQYVEEPTYFNHPKKGLPLR